METEILDKLISIERRFDFFTEAYKILHNHIIIKRPTDSYEVQVNAILKKLTEFLNHFCSEMKKVDSEYFFGTLKYMAKQIHEMQQALKELEEKGIKKNIHLDLTLDGYEMVRKTKEEYKDKEPEVDLKLKEFLDLLEPREARMIIGRYGLFGGKKLTLAQIGKQENLTSERIRNIIKKVLSKSRIIKTYRDVAQGINHFELRNDIFGEKEKN